MQNVTAITLSTTTKPFFRLCDQHILRLAQHIDCPGFQVLAASQQTLAGNCDTCNGQGPRILK